MTLRSRRAGLSLVEVLIAIFVMGIGMLALLTLFPLGALNMQKAIQDDRTGYVADNAAVAARLWWKEIWHDPVTGLPRQWDGLPTDTPQPVKFAFPELAALDDPMDLDGPGGATFPPSDPLTVQRTPPLESYPLLIDPYGEFAHRSAGNQLYRFWVAGGTRIPRRTLSALSPTPIPDPPYPPTLPLLSILRSCTLLDDITYGPGGTAVNGGEVQREGRYSWAWLLQRPADTDPPHDRVNLAVLAFSGRRVDTPADELAFAASWNAGDTVVSVLTNGEPPVEKGGWVLDASQVMIQGRPVQRAQFYRVIGVTPNSTDPRLYDLELQYPSLYTAPMDVNNPATSPGMAYFLGRFADQDTLVEVFERDPLSILSEPKP